MIREPLLAATEPHPTVIAPAPPHRRLVGPDVVRGVALIGVVVMNYHGYLNGSGASAGPDASWAQSLFDPWTGRAVSTRFAATFVHGRRASGVTLLTHRSVDSGDRAARSATTAGS